jgi:site-specific recombinase XerD
MDEIAHSLRKRRLAGRFSADHDLLIVNGVGRTLGYTRLRKAFAAARDRANLNDVTPHTCRHKFASILIDHARDECDGTVSVALR